MGRSRILVLAVVAMFLFSACTLWNNLGLPDNHGAGGGGGNNPPPIIADLTARVQDICLALLPNTWIILEEADGNVQTHKTGVNEILFQFVNIRAPYAVTVARPAAGAEPAFFQTWALRETRDITFTVPQNRANCPPGGGGGGGNPPTPAAITGNVVNSSGGAVIVQTTSGGYSLLQPGQSAFTLTGIFPGKVVLYAQEQDAQGNPTRFGLLKGITLSEGQVLNGVTLDLSAPYSTTMSGPINYPPGFLPTPGANYSFLAFNLSLAGGGYISSIGRLFGLGSGSYSVALPDFSALGLDLAHDQLYVSSFGLEVYDDRGTPFDVSDDFEANTSFFDARLTGQVTGSNPSIPINFPPLPSPQGPADSTTLSRDTVLLRWNEVPAAGSRGYTAWVSSGNQTVWQVIVGDASITSVHLPRIPNNEFDAFVPGPYYRWTVAISTDVGSSSVAGMRFKIQ